MTQRESGLLRRAELGTSNGPGPEQKTRPRRHRLHQVAGSRQSTPGSPVLQSTAGELVGWPNAERMIQILPRIPQHPSQE